MEEERFFSGYCRVMDCSRMVCALRENGELTEVDCAYGGCSFMGECTVAQAITEFLKG